MSNDPFAVSDAIKAMRAEWAITEPLMGGTLAMRKAGQALLPKHPAEEDDAYATRLGVATLFPAYSETVVSMTDRVFAEPIQLGDDIPDELKEFASDIDRQGNDLSAWGVNWFRVGLSYGLSHALVEYPKADGVRTKAEEDAAGLRPYVVMIHPMQVLGWRDDGTKLTQFRYLETVTEDDGDFGVKIIEQVRVLEPGTWKIYRKTKDGHSIHDEGVTSLNVIPLVTFYTKRVGLMCAKPLMMELAHLNIKHWQSQSDQDNILHVARVPMLAVIGPTQNHDSNGNLLPFQLVVGTGAATVLPMNADMKFVEHGGKAIEAGRQSLLDLIDEMRMAGAKLLRKDQSGTKTATQAQEDASQETSPLMRMAHHFADCIAQIFQLMANYRNLPEGGHVEIKGNFDIDHAPETSIPSLVNMANSSLLSHETLFSEMQRRGVISDEFDWADERARIEEQGPALGSM